MKLHILAAGMAAATVFGGVMTASAYDRRVVVINNTSTTIHEFYASNTGESNWQEDIFGDKALPAGNRVTVNLDDGTGYCKYDFRAVFDDGTEATKNGVNVCEVAEFSFEE